MEKKKYSLYFRSDTTLAYLQMSAKLCCHVRCKNYLKGFHLVTPYWLQAFKSQPLHSYLDFNTFLWNFSSVNMASPSLIGMQRFESELAMLVLRQIKSCSHDCCHCFQRRWLVIYLERDFILVWCLGKHWNVFLLIKGWKLKIPSDAVKKAGRRRNEITLGIICNGLMPGLVKWCDKLVAVEYCYDNQVYQVQWRTRFCLFPPIKALLGMGSFAVASFLNWFKTFPFKQKSIRSQFVSILW